MSFISGISAKIASMRQRAKDEGEFFAYVLDAASDGRLTDEEVQQISSRLSDLGLSTDDLGKIRVQAYNAALRAVGSDDRATAEEEAELERLQTVLGISDSEVLLSKRALARLRLLTEINSGNLPKVPVQNVVLQKAERAHWMEPASLLEERVVSRRYEGGSQGFSFRIAKGVSYRVGAHRGHLVADRALVPVSTGDLIITDRRVVFRGNAKSFNLRLDKILEIGLCSDGARLTDDRGKPRMVRFSSEDNTDIVGGVLSRAINDFVG